MKVLRLQEKAPPLRLSEGARLQRSSDIRGRLSRSSASKQFGGAPIGSTCQKGKPRQSGARIILERKGKMKHADTNSKSWLF
jgi:hypothetical protein